MALRQLFGKGAGKYLTVKQDDFTNAIETSDSNALDIMLEAKQLGCDLDINKELITKDGTRGTPLELLLLKDDFENASKLKHAGASFQTSQVVTYAPYPFSPYITSTKSYPTSLQEKYANNEKIMGFLNSAVPTQIINQPNCMKK